MKLITWNIQWCRGVDGNVDPGRIIREARNLGDFDVLCLQEVARNYPGLNGNNADDQFGRLASLLPGFTSIEGIAVDDFSSVDGRREFGNQILTRLPVISVFRHLLPWPADPDVPTMQRMALEVVLKTDKGPLRVTTSHLEFYSEKQREAQVERLRELQAYAAGMRRIFGRKRSAVARSKHAGVARPGFLPATSITRSTNRFISDCRRRSMMACRATSMRGRSQIPASRTIRPSASTTRNSGKIDSSAATSSA